MHVIPILGRNYTVVYKKMDKDSYGEIHKDEGEIWVRKGSTPEEIRETVVHETLHGIIFESGLNEILDGVSPLHLEEAIVRALDHGLNRSGLIRDILPPPEDEDE